MSLAIRDFPSVHQFPVFPNQNKQFIWLFHIKHIWKNKITHFIWKTTSNLNMEATHPACTLHDQNVKFPFPSASEVLKECSLGELPAFCVAIWGSIVGGAHELKQQRVLTLKHLRHFNFYCNLNYVSTSLRKRKTWLPTLFFPFINPFIFLLNISCQMHAHINDVQGTQDHHSLLPFPSPTPASVWNPLMSHCSWHEVFSTHFLQQGLSWWKGKNLILSTFISWIKKKKKRRNL